MCHSVESSLGGHHWGCCNSMPCFTNTTTAAAITTTTILHTWQGSVALKPEDRVQELQNWLKRGQSPPQPKAPLELQSRWEGSKLARPQS